MQLLSQRDPRWCQEKLGQTSLTIGRYGCTTVCLSMLSDYFGGFQVPIKIAHNVNFYTPEGFIKWLNLTFLSMKFERREYGENATNIQFALKDPDRAVILLVNDGQHWVVGMRKSLLGNDWIVADPWTGKKCAAKGVYHNVTGAAYFVRKS